MTAHLEKNTECKFTVISALSAALEKEDSDDATPRKQS